jgi:hypothetical protein
MSMKLLSLSAIAAAALLGSTALAQAPAAPAPAPAAAAAPAPVDYAQEANWLCLPGHPDVCALPLPTTALNTNGYGSTGMVVPDPKAPVDCFYVYPTVSRDPGDNSDLTASMEEKAAAAVQFARFGTVCRTYAPIYRQATLTALQKAMRGENVTRNFGLAYGDVVAAWHHYLDHYNKGRPFVLVGHSQGSIMLQMLLAQDIENSPAAKRMLSAMLIGYNVEVPEGKLVGGSFKKTPLCTSAGQTGCVVTFVSFRAASPPPEGSLFGRAAGPGMTVGCTNPARLTGGKAALDSYWYAGPAITSTKSQIAWSSVGDPPTPFLRTEGLVSGECTHKGNVGYLAISVNADPKDQRTDVIPGDVVVGGALQAGWGLHLADMNEAQGDLIRLVEAQSRAFGATKR